LLETIAVLVVDAVSLLVPEGIAAFLFRADCAASTDDDDDAIDEARDAVDANANLNFFRCRLLCLAFSRFASASLRNTS
jgi:hypothetical protein